MKGLSSGGKSYISLLKKKKKYRAYAASSTLEVVLLLTKKCHHRYAQVCPHLRSIILRMLLRASCRRRDQRNTT